MDKAGQPYILHPIRVTLQVDTNEQRISATLHDVVDDTDTTLDMLRSKGFSESAISAVDEG